MKNLNPLLHQCTGLDRCYLKVLKPRLEALNAALPGRLCFTDIDGMLEIDGRLLFVEWKRGMTIPQGQDIAFRGMTRGNQNTVLVISGTLPEMEVARYCVYVRGGQCSWHTADLAEVQEWIRFWVDETREKNRRFM